MRYDVSLVLKDIFYPDFMGKSDIGAFAGTLNADNAGVVIEGKGIVDGAKLSGRLESKASKATRYALKGTVQANQFSRYGLQIEPYLQGPLDVDVSIVDGAIFPAVNATIDATRAEAHLEDVFWRKPRGTNMTIKLKANPDKVSKRGIVDLDVSAAGMQAKGQLELDADSSDIKQFKMDRVSFGENDVSVTYQPLHNGYFVEINGRSLDLRPHLAQESKQSISKFPPLHLVANVERVLLAHDEAFRGVKGKLFCTLERCHSADISGKMAEGETFSFNIIRSPADVRTLDVRADNAGRFLKAFDLVSAMQNGKLSITGEYDDAKKGHPLTGRFIIADFMLKDAPVLGRILNLGSLTGLVDSLTGQGMRFEKLAMDLIFAEDTATLKNAIMKGPSIGVTANGDIHIGDAMINLKGTVIPAYALNSLLGEIPILGDIITGGEGQGVLGVDYSVKGSYKEPEVSVNPLSAFTPGFLRNIFGVFDDDSSTSSDGETSAPRQRRSSPAR